MRKITIMALAATLLAAIAIPASAKTNKLDTTIVETAVALSGGGAFDSNPGDFDILVQAVLATGVNQSILNGNDNYTVFAPTDQAFLNLASVLAGRSITSESEAFSVIAGAVGVSGVTAVLAYHVTEGVRNSTSVTRAQQVTMLDGNQISARGGYIDGIGSDASIVIADIRVADGMIHAIDTVLLPF
jgi:uncharacterized surface protein with fasciclin (FAS1) repeats